MADEIHGAYYLTPTNTWRTRLWHRFFPFNGPMFGSELPDGMADALYVDTDCRFSMTDRLRLLVSGKLRVRTQTLCEVSPGTVRSSSIVTVRPPDWMQR